ncbi:uncharacterized protein LOC113214155 [Frankliniella occidentalis]|uniref:Uncharacterized protein LOC113214155 n=1 Tax=Frankliniella occidentalis TaxID=133901 RepID=A0A9C6X5E6_FRAOC|nr:uncharacterized protein LOC113214155 [Frankliniella occidentalis]
MTFLSGEDEVVDLSPSLNHKRSPYPSPGLSHSLGPSLLLDKAMRITSGLNTVYLLYAGIWCQIWKANYDKILQDFASLHFNVIGSFVLKSDTWSPDVIDAGKDFVQGWHIRVWSRIRSLLVASVPFIVLQLRCHCLHIDGVFAGIMQKHCYGAPQRGRRRGRPRRVPTGNTPPRVRRPVGRPPGPARRARRAGDPRERGVGRGVHGIQPIGEVIVLSDDDEEDIYHVPADDLDFEVNGPAAIAAPPAQPQQQPLQLPPQQPPQQALQQPECSNCMHGVPTHLIMDCHHLALCSDCAQLFPHFLPNCPNCGLAIRSLVRVRFN